MSFPEDQYNPNHDNIYLAYDCLEDQQPYYDESLINPSYNASELSFDHLQRNSVRDSRHIHDDRIGTIPLN